MAANYIEPGSSLADLASAIDLSQIPEKLRCSKCKNYLINPYKTDCCGNSLCETCFNHITDFCPVCQHRPLSRELVRPNKAMRTTAKHYLKTIEKAQAEERAKSQAGDTSTLPSVVSEAIDITTNDVGQSEMANSMALESVEPDNNDLETSQTAEVQPSIEVGSPAQPVSTAILMSPQQDEGHATRQASESGDENDDDEIEIQVEMAQGEEYHRPQPSDNYEEDQSFGKMTVEGSIELKDENKDTPTSIEPNNFGMSNMGMNFNNMAVPSMAMMQQMQQMMMNNPMMGAMGMSPNMFGGFQNGGMNGMDMGMMNFNSNQNMFGWNGQNSNNFNNAFSNGMGGNYGSQFGFDMSQQGNFSQHSQNGDFQNGYSNFRGRGRGRWRDRGGFGRGRGQYNQFASNNYHGFQNSHDQAQNEMQNVQAPFNTQKAGSQIDTNLRDEEQAPDNDDFAPGGQDEVQEALGDQYEVSKEPDESPSATMARSVPDSETTLDRPMDHHPVEDLPTTQELTPVEKPIPEAYHEDFETMAPPSAPVGPSARHHERGYGFRARGHVHNRFSMRGRGSYPAQESHVVGSPARPSSQAATVAQSPPAKGLGVQGAPTGPRAMREPTAPRLSVRTNTGGFQIKGQAAIRSQSQARSEDRAESPNLNGHEDRTDERSSRKTPKHERHNGTRYDDETDTTYDRERDRKRRKSRRSDYDDYEMQDADQLYSRSNSPDRKSAHRSSRHDKDRTRDRDRDRHSANHRSSRRHRDDEANGDYDTDDYGEPAESKSSSHRASHRSGGKSLSKYDDRDRERDRDRDRDRERERDRDRERERDRDRDRDERLRKRSRHDRDREDGYDDADEDESRHRSRRHKKDHHSSGRRERDRERERDGETVDDDVGIRINGRSSNRNANNASALPTPTSATATVGPSESEKDPHTLEREARNRERMLKEQQRREKAAMDKKSGLGNGTTNGGTQKHGRGTVSGGRRVSYKYEDEVERGMDERETARWR